MKRSSDNYLLEAFDERAPKMLKAEVRPARAESPEPGRLQNSFMQNEYSPQDFCICGDEEGANVSCVANGICKGWDLELPDIDDFLHAMNKDIKKSNEDKEKPPKFLLSVPNKFVTAEATTSPPARPSITRNCYRYTFTEEKALVHAKLRLQFEGFVGVEKGMKLTDYYEYYLRKLAPTDFRRYPKRDASALTRKFKAIKHNSPKLLPYIDRHVESCFWNELVQLVAHKPLLHPIFYKEKPSSVSPCE